MKRALLSVYDKAGVVDLARALHELGWTLVSSGGTARAVAGAGVPVTDVADLTGVPAILGHRVVTLHPKVHGGLLADPTDPGHVDDMAAHGIEAIDLVVVNLYPFTDQPGIEMIDIGGPAMVRAAAKNHAHVGVVVDPADYGAVLEEIRAAGALSVPTRRRLARKAFAVTAAYDAAVVTWLDATDPDGAPVLPPTMHLALERAQELRYGENPHQQGARYRKIGTRSWWDEAVQHGGKELSYLNLFDAAAAWRLVHRFDRPAAVIVKHANPCGVAVAADLTDAYVLAHACDPLSAFGGIVALNRPVPEALAVALAPVFTEVVRGAVATTTTPWPSSWRRRTCGCCRPPRPVSSRSTCAASRAGSSCSSPIPSRSTAPRGGSSPRRRPHRPSGTTSSWRGRCAPPCRRTPSCS